MGYIVGPLNNNEVRGDFTHVAVFDYVDIDANLGSGNQVTIATIPSGGGCDVAAVFTPTQLASSADDYTVDCGTTSGDPDEFLDATALTAATTIAVYNSGDAFVQAAGTTTIEKGSHPAGVATSDTSVLVEFNGSGDLTAGVVVIALRIFDPGRFADLV